MVPSESHVCCVPPSLSQAQPVPVRRSDPVCVAGVRWWLDSNMNSLINHTSFQRGTRGPQVAVQFRKYKNLVVDYNCPKRPP